MCQNWILTVSQSWLISFGVILSIIYFAASFSITPGNPSIFPSFITDNWSSMCCVPVTAKRTSYVERPDWFRLEPNWLSATRGEWALTERPEASTIRTFSIAIFLMYLLFCNFLFHSTQIFLPLYQLSLMWPLVRFLPFHYLQFEYCEITV